jgi:hypothetical protein
VATQGQNVPAIVSLPDRDQGAVHRHGRRHRLPANARKHCVTNVAGVLYSKQPQDWCALSQQHSELTGDQKKLSGFDDGAGNVVPCLEGFQRHMKSSGDLF